MGGENGKIGGGGSELFGNQQVIILAQADNGPRLPTPKTPPAYKEEGLPGTPAKEPVIAEGPSYLERLQSVTWHDAYIAAADNSHGLLIGATVLETSRRAFYYNHPEFLQRRDDAL